MSIFASLIFLCVACVSIQAWKAPSRDQHTIFCETAISGDHEKMRSLLGEPNLPFDVSRGCPCSLYDFNLCLSPLQRASELGHAEVIKALLEDGRIDPNWTPVLVVDSLHEQYWRRILPD